ncbi:plasmid mobilization relaxase MbeA, partial [Escherichia coli]
MIVKFHARGKGGGSGPVDYLLGRERNREGATVLQGNPEEVRELIDATPFAKKYTSGVLSFAEKELPPGGREKVMASFERVLMPGLEKNQYSILWVEHQDKGRLELNFVIPNMELQTGKRLQPYYDRADRPRIDAWQTLVNHHYGLHDPNAPENRRTLTLPDNLPETKQALAEGVTRGIDALYHAGEIKGRQDVIQALTEAGLEVVRVTRSSISIADPNGGRNIRLKGAFYEQSFTDGRGVREKAERESRIYRENAERRVQEARRICKQGTDLKRIFNQERYQRPYNSPERTAGEVSENDRRYDGRALENRTENERETLAVADYRLSTDVCHDRESAVVPGHEDKREYEYSPR